MLTIRPATLDEVPVLEALIRRSVLGLQAQDYTPDQLTKALGSVYGVDRQLIRDGSYLVVEEEGKIVGCGGWSRRKTLYGADSVANRDDAPLDPAVDAARIRAFFIDPDHARRGIGSRLLEACETAAREFGFTRFELASTLTGIALYRERGYVGRERQEVPLPGGGTLAVLRMVKSV